ncbi:MAG: hypothetical protein IJC20_00255, partial [Clostridia bacterium]|nr:hypothetical protein [Clostridia bacterium]
MADNNERSRADDLFDILNSLNGSTVEPEPEKDSKNDTSSRESMSRVDEIIEILSSGAPISEEPTEEPSQNDEGEIPVAIFSHLSDESDVAPSANNNENTPHFTDHLSNEDETSPIETETAEEPEPIKKKSKTGSAVKRVFGKLSIVPKAIVYILLIVIVSAYLSYYIITIGNDVFALVSDTREVTVTIEDGADHESVAKMLKENGVIEYDWVYKIYMKYRGDGDSSTEY